MRELRGRPTAWWISPAGAVLLVVPATLWLAWHLTDGEYRLLYGSPKDLTYNSATLFLAGMLAFVLGAVLARCGRAERLARGPLLELPERRWELLVRAAGALYWTTIIGYVAWTLSAVSGISIVWLLGFVRALVLRPVLLFPDRLVVRGGIQWTADVPRAAIESVEHGWTVRAPGKRTAGYLRATPLVQPNVLLRLRTPVEVRGMYGRRRTVHLIGVSVDDPAALAEALRREG